MNARESLFLSLFLHLMLLLCFSTVFEPKKKSLPEKKVLKVFTVPPKKLSSRKLVRSVYKNNLKNESAKFLGEQSQKVNKQQLSRSKILSPPKSSMNSGAGTSSVGSKKAGVTGRTLSTLSAFDRDEIAIGSETVLNTKRYRHASFFNRIKDRIEGRWSQSIQTLLKNAYEKKFEGIRYTQVEVYINRQGYLKEAFFTEKSDVKAFDRIAMDALNYLGKLSNIPSEFLVKDVYKFKIGFEVLVEGPKIRLKARPYSSRFQRPIVR